MDFSFSLLVCAFCGCVTSAGGGVAFVVFAVVGFIYLLVFIQFALFYPDLQYFSFVIDLGGVTFLDPHVFFSLRISPSLAHFLFFWYWKYVLCSLSPGVSTLTVAVSSHILVRFGNGPVTGYWGSLGGGIR